MNENNVYIHDFFSPEGALLPSRFVNATKVFKNEAYVNQSCQGIYPPLKDVLVTLKEKTSIAYSSKYAVFMCNEGIRWLYRNKRRIGLFTGVDTLCLFPKASCYREEIMEDPLFTLDKIQEF